VLLWASAAKFLPGISAAGRVSTEGGFRGFKGYRVYLSPYGETLLAWAGGSDLAGGA
jgi:hypothetical protein